MTSRGFMGVGVAAIVCTAAVAFSHAQSPGSTEPRYLVPPRAIVDILEAPPPPTVVVSPTRDTLVVLERRSMPPLAELARPMLRLAGRRIDPKADGPHRRPDVVGLTVKSIAGGDDRQLAVPAGATVLTMGYSPDGKRFAYATMGDASIDLWVADVATGAARAVPGVRLSAVTGTAPCEWLRDNRTLLCTTVPANRGQPPAPPAVPAGPNVQENAGKLTPAWTYQDLLASAHDEALFEYYGSSQAAWIDADTRQATLIGQPGLLAELSTSPSGEFVLVERLKRPFSRLLPADDVPKDVEVWTRRGDKVRTVADLPLADTVPLNGVPTGPRAYRWHPTAPAALVWVEALDGGDPKATVPHRDRIVMLAAPFAGDPAELARTEYRFQGISWTDKGVALLTEYDRPKRWTRTWLIDAPGAAPRKLWDRSAEDAYGNPGTPVTRPDTRTILQVGDAIYLTGTGASPQGDRPFLDRLILTTLAAERLFRCDEMGYETVVALLDPGARRLLTRRETKTSPPNYFVRELPAGAPHAITAYQDPAPQLAGVEKRLITYERKDGVKLSATLYLPPGYKAGERLPVLAWAYPREFTDPNAAGQVTGSPHRFTTIAGASHLLLLTQGYAILDNPAMPIVGPGETANDTYVEQLVASAQAAVDTLVEMGVADRDRVGIGGHSYGAFMAANLLAHSDIFRAGIARSGAYNRTLTPFGFQNEQRTFWEVPQIYAAMSPFWFAHKVNEPILLTHGEADNNSGTFPVQSERFYMALKGHGATVRYVTLPHEAHGYAARESVLHTVAEMLDWMDTWVKQAKPR